MHFITRAAHIVVIGYSFPETDAFMTRLLAQGLMKNYGLESFTIIDIQPEEKWQKRIDDTFTPSLRDSKFAFCCMPGRRAISGWDGLGTNSGGFSAADKVILPAVLQ